VILLTGATGLVGRSLLGRLADGPEPVRCLVRDPRRLGAERVRVQIALGDLADPDSFRNAMRGVDVVIHLAAAIRDQPQGSIEELAGIATWRLVDAAQRADVGRFVFFSALGASTQSRSRFLRAKALAEEAVRAAPIDSIIFAPSLIYAPGDPFLSLLAGFARIPGVMPLSGQGRAAYQPIWVQDVADCVVAALARTDKPVDGSRSVRYELAGPQTLTHEQIVRIVLGSLGKRRAILHVPTPIVARSLRVLSAVAGSHAFATWDEAELMEVPLVSALGTRDVEALGVTPREMSDVLGTARVELAKKASAAN
jgi:NADH dehydrogenase